MATEGWEDEYQRWYNSRPAYVRRAVDRWPPMTMVLIDHVKHYVLGYSETAVSEQSEDILDLMLIISSVNPADDYPGAIKAQIFVCAKHLEMV